VWRHYFGTNAPTSIVVPTSRPGFAIADAQIEINLVALRRSGRARKEIVESPRFVGMAGQPAAVRAGDLLMISGLLAVDRDGPAAGIEADPDAPHFGSTIEAQMNHMLETADDICRRAGTELANTVRIQQFHTDLREFYPSYQVWQRWLPEAYLPFSVVRVPAPLAVPACTIMLDLWVYIPEAAPVSN
jgi:enamine deaminase RidA (YjgF/YER057c/UK114 family)